MQAENNTASGLKKISFSTSIHAPKEKVWNILWDDENYKRWTAAFAAGSCAVSDWQEGSKILFLDAKGDGMYCTIAKKIPDEFISFKYNGEVKKNLELPADEKTSDWVNGYENYTLKDEDGITSLDVEMTVTNGMLEYFNKTFPVALELVKKLAEAKTNITVEAQVNAPVEKVWAYWIKPEHITQWNNASDDWHTPRATNDLQVGGKFLSRMEAKDGSFGFDFRGVYDEVITNELIAYTLDDGRKVKIIFSNDGNETKITENFEAENENPLELQRGGWQAILNNFKKYAEAN